MSELDIEQIASEMRAAAKGAGACRWIAGHLIDENSSCNCRFIFDGAHWGGIGEVYVDNGLSIADGGNDAPSIELAKANLRHIATSNPANVIDILDDRDAKAREIMDQCRLNGMGTERELALAAKLSQAERERDELQARLARYDRREGTHGFDCHLWGPRHYACLLSKFEHLASLPKRAGEALRPIVSALNIVEKQDPLVPDEMACLRAAFDWYVRYVGEGNTEIVERDSLRVGDLRMARSALTDIDATLKEMERPAHKENGT